VKRNEYSRHHVRSGSRALSHRRLQNAARSTKKSSVYCSSRRTSRGAYDKLSNKEQCYSLAARSQVAFPLQTSLSCCRRTRATRCFTPSALYRDTVDGQCDKRATVVSSRLLTTLLCPIHTADATKLSNVVEEWRHFF